MHRPVFNDPSGVRAITVQWASRALLVLSILVAATLVLTLRTHVALRGVPQFLPQPADDTSRFTPPSVDDNHSTNSTERGHSPDDGTLVPTVPLPTSGASTPAVPHSTSSLPAKGSAGSDPVQRVAAPSATASAPAGAASSPAANAQPNPKATAGSGGTKSKAVDKDAKPRSPKAAAPGDANPRSTASRRGRETG